MTFSTDRASIGVEVQEFAAYIFPVFLFFNLRGIDSKGLLKLAELCSAGSGEQSVVAYTHKPSGKNVLTKTPQKLSTFKGHNFYFVVAVITPLKTHARFIHV